MSHPFRWTFFVENIAQKVIGERQNKRVIAHGGGMEKGYLALVLHSHLPYVRHQEHDRFLEEDWLYEAITETYIPLINVFDGLVNDGVDFRIPADAPLISMPPSRFGGHQAALSAAERD
jgi:hypothetical protein